jgi:ribosomal protein S12 methylthiotransferase
VLDGAFELNLIGQDTTSYGDDIGYAPGMPGMLRAVSDAVGDAGGAGWVRLMYAYPSNFSDAMIGAMAELASEGRVLPYIDMPLQHASDRVLTAMRRHVTSTQQRRVIEKLREKIPGMAIRTTFISGFPGETEEDHKELLRFVEDVGFEALGVFEYSREPGTVAGTMEGDSALAVPPEIKARRRGEVMALQQKLAFARAAKTASAFDESRPEATGERLDVLIDEPTGASGVATSGVGRGGKLYRGRTRFQAPMIDAVTYVQSTEKLAPGELIKCVVVASDGYDLVARPVSDLQKRVGLKILR